MVSTAIAVLPVWRSPRINSRWPRPMGISASTTFSPVCKGTLTGARSMIVGAGRSTGRGFSAAIRRLHYSSGPLHFVARVQVLMLAQQDDADFVLIHVKRDAQQIAREAD